MGIPIDDPWNDYDYPGTNVLKNHMGIRDEETLKAVEHAMTTARIAQLYEEPIAGSFDRRHLQSIHRHLFQDIYPWAGQIRIGPAQEFMTKNGFRYARWSPDLNARLDAAIADHHPRVRLRRPEVEEFAEHLSEFWNAVNTIHPFHEGNTRTQVIFFAQYAAANQMHLDVANLTPGRPLHEPFVDARFAYQRIGANYPLTDVLTSMLRPMTENEMLDAPRPSNRYSSPSNIDEALQRRDRLAAIIHPPHKDRPERALRTPKDDPPYEPDLS